MATDIILKVNGTEYTQGTDEYNNYIQNEDGEWKNYFQIIVNDLEILKFVEIEEDNNIRKQ